MFNYKRQPATCYYCSVCTLFRTFTKAAHQEAAHQEAAFQEEATKKVAYHQAASKKVAFEEHDVTLRLDYSTTKNCLNASTIEFRDAILL